MRFALAVSSAASIQAVSRFSGDAGNRELYHLSETEQVHGLVLDQNRVA